jgi:hypothetical protein
MIAIQIARRKFSHGPWIGERPLQLGRKKKTVTIRHGSAGGDIERPYAHRVTTGHDFYHTLKRIQFK